VKLRYFLIPFCLFFLVGCSESQLNRVGIVVAVAIDKDQATDKIIYTAQVIRPGSLIKNSSSKEAVIEMVTSEGTTIFEAIRNNTQEFDRINFYAHTKVIILSEAVAKDGALSYLDFFVRGKELRGYTLICVAKDVEAREIIGVKEGIDNIGAIYLMNIIENQKFHNKSIASTVIQYYRDVLKEGINPTMGVLELVDTENYANEDKQTNKSQAVKLTGTAVFDKDVLVGYLTEEETKGYNWIHGEAKDVAMVLPSILEEGRFVTIEIEKQKSKIIPKIKDGDISFTIEVEVNASLVEEQGEKSIIYPKAMLDYLDELKVGAEKQIDEDINISMKRAQKELDSDIFGFGVALNNKYPKKWKEVKDHWDDIFPYIVYDTEIKVNFIGTDLKEGIFEIK
jgi:spore germination protein KC